jgi:hypothetical protein
VKGLVFVSQEEVASDDRASMSMRPGEVRRVHVKEQHHITGVVCDAIVLPRRDILVAEMSKLH